MFGSYEHTLSKLLNVRLRPLKRRSRLLARHEGPVGSLVGDLLVRIPSSSGRGNSEGRRIPFELGSGVELTGLNHFDLLNHPAVYEQIRAWVSRARERPTA